jgi:2-desacetyl-2-hydroxyethyl bacteriochlorophyllide A dehydrogenase
MKTMSACLTGIEQIELRSRELEIGEDEILVKTHLAGICGTDKNLYHGILPRAQGLAAEMRKDFVYPFFFGHEGGGTVVEVGERVRKFWPGDHVIAFAWVDTFSEYFKAVEEDLEPAPDGLHSDLACLGEPIGCAVFSGLESGVQLGDVVAVFGMGFAGQIMAQVLKKKGAHLVIAVDVVEEKLKLAKALGTDVTINAQREDPVSAILDLTGARGADMVVEMAGTQDSLHWCNATVRHNGTIVLYSWVTQDITINISRWHNDSLRVINTGLVHHSPEERRLWTPYALRPVVQRQLTIEPLITHKFGLSDIARAFEAASHDPSAIKIVIEASS